MYTGECKSDFCAQCICASDKYLENFNRPKTPEFPTAKYIWGRRYTRVHFRRIFCVEKPISRAEVRKPRIYKSQEV